MERYLAKLVLKDLKKKIVLLSGPRQVGKTTLSKSLFSNFTYLNYDFAEHRLIISKKQWVTDSDLIIFDELHKMPNWKRWLKGIYDVVGINPPIIVTGSARLDLAKKMGDSLAGRHFTYRLNPITLKEVGDNVPNAFERLMKVGGFPEPFLTNDLDFYKKWQSSHLDLILRQDLIDLEQIKSINQLETLLELLRHKVGTPCSYSSLAQDLQVNHNTVKRWLMILENLYVVFRVLPYHRNVARSLLKTPKYYFYDLGRVPEKNGARFENLIALALLSEINIIQDTTGRKLNLNYLRDKEGNEIDFFISEEKENILALEAKWSDTTPEKSFKRFFNGSNLNAKTYIQLVGNATTRQQLQSGLKIELAKEWLKDFEL